MKENLQSLLEKALNELKQQHIIPIDLEVDIQIERSRHPEHGDFASNIALVLAKHAKMKPRDLAQKIVEYLPSSPNVKKVEIAGPGFINFHSTEASRLDIIPTILDKGEKYGQSNKGEGKSVYMEYLSANPTGPLHVGHGRSAAISDCIARLLKSVGYRVHREYYVNDAGRQIRILAISVWLRYLELLGENISLPINAYRGDYIIEIAKELKNREGKKFFHPWADLQPNLSKGENVNDDKEAYMDALIDTAVKYLGKPTFDNLQKMAVDNILSDIEDDLGEFGVEYDRWFRESELFSLHLIEEGIELLKKQGHAYERDGALWFRATSLGDEKDRVLIRKNGQSTYFASDVAYHLYKYQQNFDEIMDVFGADHHGYVSRIRCFLKGLGKDPKKLKVILVQFAILWRGKEKVPMSTRAGQFTTLRELRYEVGNDAARFFYILRKPEQHLDFDLELAKSQSSDNPIYYIQYAHARICSVWRQLDSFSWDWDKEQGLEHLSLLTSEHEKNLLEALSRYPEVIYSAAIQHEPHLLAHYLQQTAAVFHGYYNAVKFLVEESQLRNARLCLLAATKQILSNGLKTLGLSAPEVM